MTDYVLERTRRGLHTVAELVLAGPQYRTSGTIKLRVAVDGFATVAAPDVRVEGIDLVAPGLRVPISGETSRSLAEAIGVDVGGPAGLYEDGSGASIDDELVLDPVAATRIVSAYTRGAAALRVLAPEAEPVLWPEHFDVGVRVDDINYGISPGDTYLSEPYAYVGVDPVPDGEFWNAPFGVARPMSDFTDADKLNSFLTEAKHRWNSRTPR